MSEPMQPAIQMMYCPGCYVQHAVSSESVPTYKCSRCGTSCFSLYDPMAIQPRRPPVWETSQLYTKEQVLAFCEYYQKHNNINIPEVFAEWVGLSPAKRPVDDINEVDIHDDYEHPHEVE